MMFIAYLQQMKLHNSGLYDYCGDTGTVGQFLLHPSNDTEYCDYTCLYVRLSLREHISGTAGPIGTKLLCGDIPYGRGSVHFQHFKNF